MQWLALSIDTKTEMLDSVCNTLAEHGITDLQIEDEADFLRFLDENRTRWDYVDEFLRKSMTGLCRVTFYLEDTANNRARRGQLQDLLETSINLREVRDEDWNSTWKQYYRPLPIGARFLIVPEWETVPTTERIPLRLDPGLLFGTGSHPTTALCLETMERYVNQKQHILDIGCGSGILSIAAILLGALQVTACDIDECAPAIVTANAALNQIDAARLTVLGGDILRDPALQAQMAEVQPDLIAANIVADVIIPLAPFAAAWLAPGGYFIASGIIGARVSEVKSALQTAGFGIVEKKESDDWYCFVCTKT